MDAMGEHPAVLDDASVARALRDARLVALDVDGTLTDGVIAYVEGFELQRFCVHDGQGLVWLRELGVAVAWITGRGCAATRRRADELGVRLFERCGPKAAVLERVQAELGLAPERTIAMGDDLPDLALATRAALFACPADARPEVRARAQLVTRAAGGRGAVRELAELVLRAQGAWEALAREAAR